MKTNSGDFLENSDPFWDAIFIITMGFIILLGAILNWNWLFEDNGRIYNIAWISHIFGRTIARIIMGALGIMISLITISYFFF